MNLLDALDRRMQEGTFEPSSLAAVARLFGTGTVVLRSDLAYERFGLPRPRAFWEELTEPTVAPGLDPPVPYGPTTPNVALIPLIDASTLRDSGTADPPAVALFGVRDAVPIVHTAPVDQPVVLSGDGDGIVDAAAAGLIDGNQLVQELTAMSDTELAAALARGADLVVTDSNRRRADTWFSSLRDDKGATERAGQTLPDPNGDDYRFDLFPGSTDDSRTVVEQEGGTVDASADGGTARPEDRATRAFDHDLRTSWRVGGAEPGRRRAHAAAGRAGAHRPRHPRAAAGRPARPGAHPRERDRQRRRADPRRPRTRLAHRERAAGRLPGDRRARR